ncbi:hypothetical protein OPV22_022869 [Ensete ventricosum]|uniref:Uncharacterized protein n=1 Tax=Ensete ventricosum TaxID=4639 RepID=A0AAV8QKH7_ENSVE|nr:hypothetical protein OPV22_022869 [Ensete ventricosum]
MAIRTCCLDPLHTVRGPHVCCGRGERTKRRQIQSQSDGVLSGRRREYMSQALEELGFHFPAAVEWLCFVCFHYVTLPVRLRTVPLQILLFPLYHIPRRR